MLDRLRSHLPMLTWYGALSVLAALVGVDAWQQLQLHGLYAVAAVLASTAAGTRRTAAVATLAVVAAALSGLWAQDAGGLAWGVRFVGCAAIGALAVLGARLQEGQQRRLQRRTTMAQQMLDALAVELVGARTVKEVADGFVTHMVSTVGATSAMVLRRDADEVLRTVVWQGRGSATADQYQEIPLSADLPGAVAVREDVDLHHWSVAEIEARLPALRGYYTTDRSLHLMPLRHDGRPFGLLALTFPAGTFRRGEQAFLLSLASALSSAVRRGEELQRYDAAVQRTTLLSEASLRLSRALDRAALTAEIGTLLVPRFADWCSLQLLQDDRLVPLLIQHRDPETTTWAQSMLHAFPTRMDAPSGAPNVVRTGVPELYPFIPAELVAASAVNDEHGAILQRLGFTSAIIAPLRGRDGVIGTVTLIHADSGRTYDEQDLEFLEAVSDRIAVALEVATSFEEQTHRLADVTQVAQAAQLAILAPPPGRAGPVDLAARYVSAAAAAQIGGDLYEVITVPDGVRLLVGDVRGKGLTAVRTATVVLGAFRAAAPALDGLGDIVIEMDRRIRPFLADSEEFVTAVVLQVGHDGRTEVVSCGHPPPVVVTAGGTTRLLEVHPTLPLGLGVMPEPTVDHLGEGDRLLLYTDGLIEARRPDGSFIDTLPLVTQALLAEPCLGTALDHLLTSLGDATGHGLDDDLALLLAEFSPTGSRTDP